MAYHLFKSSFGQCDCRWCGRRRGADGGICGVTDDMRVALVRWVAGNGAQWKSRLLKAWEKGEDLSPELQQLRNVIGPSGLMKIPTRVIDRFREQINKRNPANAG